MFCALHVEPTRGMIKTICEKARKDSEADMDKADLFAERLLEQTKKIGEVIVESPEKNKAGDAPSLRARRIRNQLCAANSAGKPRFISIAMQTWSINRLVNRKRQPFACAREPLGFRKQTKNIKAHDYDTVHDRLWHLPRNNQQCNSRLHPW